ncbi:hypothetical protein VTK56DRAFT_9329 [Thermocarpiscus australiensis]
MTESGFSSLPFLPGQLGPCQAATGSRSERQFLPTRSSSLILYAKRHKKQRRRCSPSACFSGYTVSITFSPPVTPSCIAVVVVGCMGLVEVTLVVSCGSGKGVTGVARSVPRSSLGRRAWLWEMVAVQRGASRAVAVRTPRCILPRRIRPFNSRSQRTPSGGLLGDVGKIAD